MLYQENKKGLGESENFFGNQAIRTKSNS